MTCFCDVNCPIVVKSSSIEMSGGNLVITTPLVNLANMPNLQKIDLILCQCLPSDAGTAPGLSVRRNEYGSGQC